MPMAQRFSPNTQHSPFQYDHAAKPFHWRFAVIVGLVLVLVIGSCTGIAFARAGGGESFGGGGFSSGSYHGSGGYSGGGTPVSPHVALIIIIIIVILIVLSSQQAQQQHVTRTIRRGRQRQAEKEQQAALQQIRSRDPEFSPQTFLQRARTAFLKIQDAWSNQDLTTIRPFVSDGIFERFSLQIGMQQAEELRNVMEKVQVQQADLAALFSTSQFDTLHVRIQASALDYNLNLKTDRKISGSEHSGAFVEIWSFCRRPGAKSLKTHGPIEGNCPRCGALLNIVDRAKCPACGAQVNSGEYDWVLTEITQESEWQVPEVEQQLPGMAELVAADPGFNVQHVEDRVSVMFWRMRAAEFYRDGKYAAPVLMPEFRDIFIKKMSSNARYWKDPAVGQVELIDGIPVTEGMDQLRVLVRWSGTLIDKVSGRDTVLRDQTIYTHLFTLERRHGAQSVPAGTFTSAGCAHCGAPLQVNEAGECVYCGACLTNGEFDWVLRAVESYSPELAQAHAVHLASSRADSGSVMPPAAAELPLTLLAKVMLADHVLDPRERAALEQLAARSQVTPQQLDQIIRQAQVREIEIPLPQNSSQAMAMLNQLIVAVLADGQISREELRLLRTYAQRVGLAEQDVTLAINRERARAYQAARNILES